MTELGNLGERLSLERDDDGFSLEYKFKGLTGHSNREIRQVTGNMALDERQRKDNKIITEI